MTFQTAALQHINDSRAARGLPPLQASTALDRVADNGDFNGCAGIVVRGRCRDMGEREYFSHTIKNCAKSFTHMLVAAGINHSGTGENVALMSGTDDELVAASNLHGQLMSDSGHAANILNPAFTHVGIGMWRSTGNTPWRGSPPPAPPNSPLFRVFITTQIFATNPVPADIPGAAFHPVTPTRLLDTRTGAGGSGPLGAHATLDLQVSGSAGIPATGVSAVVLNVAVTNPTAQGFLTLFPTGSAVPLAANLNFTPNLTVANLAVVKLGAGGRVSIFNAHGSTDVIADVAGWFDDGSGPAGSRFHPLTPTRILDSRPANGGAGPVGPGATLDLPVVNTGGVPGAGVAAVVLNLTVTEPAAAGFLTVYPGGAVRPGTANVNFAAGSTVCNLVVARVGAGGSITIANSSAGSAELIADVAGWFDDGAATGGARFHPVAPSRLLDTRAGQGKVGTNATLNLRVTGVGAVPSSGVGAVVLNVTVAEPTAQSFITVFPAGENRPNSANLVFVGGQIVPNLVVAKVGAGGNVSVFNAGGSTHVIADVAGWFGT